MQGHIRRRGKRSWSLAVELPRGDDGQRRQKWETVRGTKKEAEARLAQLLHEVNTGQHIEPSKSSLSAYLDYWLTQIQPSVSEKTYESYASFVRRHIKPALGSHILDKLKPMHIQAYYTQIRKAISDQSAAHHHRVLHKALKDAVRWRMIPTNPTDAVTPPRPRTPEMQTLEAAQVVKLLQVAKDTSWHIPVLLAVATGMRRGEILGLKWDDINWDEGTLSVRRSLQTVQGKGVRFLDTKTPAAVRSIALPDSVLETLRAHKKASKTELISALPSGGPIYPSDFSKAIPQLLKKAELPKIRLHDLRHSHATMLFAAGEHPKVVSERLGHSSVSITTDLYGHVTPTMQRQAAKKMDALLQPEKPDVGNSLATDTGDS